MTAMLRRLFELGMACAALPAAPAGASVPVAWPLDDTALARARHDFDRLALEAAALPPDRRIAFANVVVNRLVAFADDAELGANDVWLTPLETLARGRGDCEDIAIAKFFLLLAAGLDADDVRLLYARGCDPATPGRSPAHLVAVARHPFADPLVLDNLNLMALPASLRTDLEPVFSFDRARLWAGLCGPCRGSARHVLRPWRQLLDRDADQRERAIVSFRVRTH
jgi:predicted transglutaminase-like cysteine proteinase